MKREAQTFAWVTEFVGGVYDALKIEGRKDTPMAGKVLTFGINDYPEEIREKILAAGHKSLFQQRTSQVETDTEKLQYWTDLHELLTSGEWEREGAARGAPIVGAWVEALAEFKSTSVSAIQATLRGLPKDKRDAIRKGAEAKLAKEIEAIKTARAAEKVDLSDLE